MGELLTRLTICSLCILTIFILNLLPVFVLRAGFCYQMSVKGSNLNESYNISDKSSNMLSVTSYLV